MPNEPLADCVERIDLLLNRMEALPNDAVRQDVREVVQCLLDYHAAALARLLTLLPRGENDAPAIVARLAGDELVGSLLLLHGLHPADLQNRLLEALHRVRPFLESHGGDVELVDFVDGVVRLRLKGSCQGCPNSAATLRSRIEQAIHESAPEVEAVEVEEMQSQAPAHGFVALTQLHSAPR